MTKLYNVNPCDVDKEKVATKNKNKNKMEDDLAQIPSRIQDNGSSAAEIYITGELSRRNGKSA